MKGRRLRKNNQRRKKGEKRSGLEARGKERFKEGTVKSVGNSWSGGVSACGHQGPGTQAVVSGTHTAVMRVDE